MAIQDRKTGGNEDSIIGEIIIYCLIIMILLLYLLYIVERVDEKNKIGYSPNSYTVGDPEKDAEYEKINDIIAEINDYTEIYSRQSFEPVTKKIGDLLDDLAGFIENRKVKDTKQLMYDLGNMAEKIKEYVRIYSSKISDSEKKYLTKKIENLKRSLNAYTMRDAAPIAEKLNNIIAVINNSN